MKSVADALCDRAEVLAATDQRAEALATLREALAVELGFPRALELMDAIDAGVEDVWATGRLLEGDLEVRGLLGRGGMGVVYRVHHRAWGVDLALKTPLPELVADPQARARFEREARAWIDLGVHPHVVQCWFVREIAGLPRLVLELVDGGTLDETVAAGAIDRRNPEAVIDVALQICDGLAHAHARGIVHRDLKPSNLLRSGDGRIQITDLGLARPSETARAAQAGGVGLASSGALLGTPAYGAPEQWRDAARVDGRADLYALGVILYELCAGRRPFDTGSESHAEIIARQLVQTPDLAPVCGPAPLVSVIERLLRKDPAARYSDVGAARDALAVAARAPRRRPSARETSATTLTNQGASLWDLGDAAGAHESWRRAIDLDSRQAEALYNDAVVSWRRGEIDDLVAIARVSAAAASPRGQLALAYLHHERGDFSAARVLIDAALRDRDVAREASAWELAVDCAAACGDDGSATTAAGRAAELGARLGSLAAPVATTIATFILDEPYGSTRRLHALGQRFVLACRRWDDYRAERRAVDLVDLAEGGVRTIDAGGAWPSPGGMWFAVSAGAVHHVDGQSWSLAPFVEAAWPAPTRLLVRRADEIAAYDVVEQTFAWAIEMGGVIGLVASPGHVLAWNAHELVAVDDDGRVAWRQQLDVRGVRIAGTRTVIESAAEIRVIELDTGAARAIAIRGARVLSASSDRAVIQLDETTQQVLLVDLAAAEVIDVLAHGGWRHAAIAPEGARVAIQASHISGTTTAAIQVFDRDGGALWSRPEVWHGNGDDRFDITGWTDDGRHLLAADTGLVALDAATGRVRHLAPARGRAELSAGRTAFVATGRFVDGGRTEIARVRVGDLPDTRRILVSRGATVSEHRMRADRFDEHLAAARAAWAQRHATDAVAMLDAARGVAGHEHDDGLRALAAAMGRSLPARRLRDLWVVRELPFQVFRAAITPDGSLLAGVCTGPAPTAGPIVLLTPDGREQRRLEGPSYSVTMSEDGAYVIGAADGELCVWEVATGRVVVRQGVPNASHLACYDGLLFGLSGCWRLPDLAPVDPPATNAPLPTARTRGRVVACTPRFCASESTVALWDRVRDRAVWRLPITGSVDAVTLGGRFLLVADGTTVTVVDAAVGVAHRVFELPRCGDNSVIRASRDGRYAVLCSLTSSWLLELDWELDPVGDPDPLLAAFGDNARPPIVDDLLRGDAAKPDVDRRLAMHHPELEVVVARQLPAAERATWTRRALLDPAIAADASAWRQLAEAALEADEVVEAADAAAEGLSRAGDDEALFAVAGRAEARRRAADVTPDARWEASAVAVAVVDDAMILAGGEDGVVIARRADGTVLYRFATGSPIRALAAAGTRLAAATAGGDAIVWDVATGARLAVLATERCITYEEAFGMTAYGGGFDESYLRKMEVRAVAFAPDGTLLTAGDDCQLRFWDVAAERAAPPVWLSPNGSVLTTCGGTAAIPWRGGAVVISESRARACDRGGVWTAELGPATALALGGEEVVLGCPDGRVRVPARALELEGHAGPVRAVTARGEWIASAGADGTVRWWRDGRPIARGLHSGVCAVAIGDGWVASGSAHELCLWRT